MLARVDGEPRDLRLPLPDGATLEILTTRDRDDPDALAVLRHSAAHLLAEAVRRLHPGREGRDRAADRERLLLRLRVPRADPRGRPRGDRGGDRGASSRRGATWSASRRSTATRRGRASSTEGEPYKVELVDTADGEISLYTQGDFTDLCRGPHLQDSKPIKALQADRARRRVLARRREEHAADADLRHGVLHAGRPRRVPRAARAGARERPSPARPAARPVPPPGRFARVAVLASRRG